MIYIAAIINILSLLILWLSSLKKSHKSISANISTVLYILVVYRTGINITYYLSLILENNRHLTQFENMFANFHGVKLISDNIIMAFFAGIIIYGVFYLFLVKKSLNLSEKSARFFLDSVPQKMMNIDYELSKKMCSDREARDRKEKIDSSLNYIGHLDSLGKMMRMEYFINLSFFILISILLVPNILNRDYGLIVVAVFLDYFIPLILFSSFLIYLVKDFGKKFLKKGFPND